VERLDIKEDPGVGRWNGERGQQLLSTDGYCVEKGTIRQFVAMPLGRGYTAEEQVTGQAEHGGLQIVAYPMKAEAYRKLYSRRDEVMYDMAMEVLPCAAAPDMGLAPAAFEGGRRES